MAISFTGAANANSWPLKWYLLSPIITSAVVDYVLSFERWQVIGPSPPRYIPQTITAVKAGITQKLWQKVPR